MYESCVQKINVEHGWNTLFFCLCLSGRETSSERRERMSLFPASTTRRVCDTFVIHDQKLEIVVSHISTDTFPHSSARFNTQPNLSHPVVGKPIMSNNYSKLALCRHHEPRPRSSLMFSHLSGGPSRLDTPSSPPILPSGESNRLNPSSMAYIILPRQSWGFSHFSSLPLQCHPPVAAPKGGQGGGMSIFNQYVYFHNTVVMWL